MSGWQRTWRIAVFTLLAAGIVLGTIGKDDRTWPFAPMTMFAFSVSRDGDVHSLSLEADTITGTRVVVPLGAGGIGLERAEIEGQAGLIEATPKRLQAVAVAAYRSLPDAERYASVSLIDTVSTLRAGVVITTRRDTKATWRVVDPTRPVDLS